MTIRVVVAAAVVADGLVLAARRTSPAALAGLWEFPGGQVEAGETDAGAPARECLEELGARATVGRLVGVVALDSARELRLYLAAVEGSPPRAGADHDELRWLRPDQFAALDWLPADRALLPGLAQALS